MKHIVICIIGLFCFLNAEAQVRLRVASWNIEELNLFKLKGIPYKVTGPLSVQRERNGADQQLTASEVISDFITTNNIDILFIQEVIPFAACNIGLDGVANVIDEIKTTDWNLPNDYEVTTNSFYHDDIKHKIDKENFTNRTNYPSVGYRYNKIIPLYGESYVCIYNSKKIQFLSKGIELDDNYDFQAKHKNKKNQKIETSNVRPPAMVKIKLKKDANDGKFFFEKDSCLYIYNYHGFLPKEKGEKSQLPNDFNEIYVYLIKSEYEKLGNFDNTPVIFLGDMNKTGMQSAIGRETAVAGGRLPVDYIYASPSAERFVNSKIQKVTTYKNNSIRDRRNYGNPNFYTTGMKYINEKEATYSESNVPKPRHFSDHNPIYTELIFGGATETFAYKKNDEGRFVTKKTKKLKLVM